MSINGELVTLDYDDIKIDNERYEAILFVFGDAEIWLPRCLLELDVDAETVEVPEWLALKEGLI